MSDRYLDIAFTPSVRAAQDANGSGDVYGRILARSDGVAPDRIGPDEAAFIADRDSFYMGSVSETGWPYVQHRGGPRGFVKILDDREIGIADYRGNRQYVSLGNLARDDRVSLFFMDYGRRARLKIFARARAVTAEEAPDLLARLADPDYRARIERGLVFTVEAFDWNCPQHITERFTRSEIEAAVGVFRARIAELEARLAALETE
ncbi:MAG: pyridoxamine 5'-phosphate oxidase family protein [Paracoccaceae bacterium]